MGTSDWKRAILERGGSSVCDIVLSTRILQEAGADYLLIPRNISHYFFDDILKQIEIKIISMVEETV